jgi:tRNA pseudouridine55 synthase
VNLVVERKAVSLDGVIVVDKPEGWTSHDVVGKMRGIAGTKRVGHLGTLDPIATGVLPLVIGQATRLAQFWDRAEKEYETVARFGFATSTYDRAGEACGPDSLAELGTQPHITAEQIEACLAPMRGEIDQAPPPVSAKKIGGVPAYKFARKNIPIDLAAVRVSVYELSLLDLAGTRARLRVRCSAGTYVRAIVHELGLSLGCGAHVDALVRTRSGPFAIAQALALERLQQLKDEDRLEEALIPAAGLLPEIPSVFVDDIAVTHIRQGRDFNVSPFRVNAGAPHVKAIGPDGRLVAIAEIAMPNLYHPIVVLN